MRDNLITPIVLAGGKGTRLWPMSRSQRPKQFLALTGDLSLYQQTLKRLAEDDRYARPIVITNSEYRFIVAEQAFECGIELGEVLLEPVARNTAPAITAAVLVAGKDEPRLVHIVASDHDIDADGNYLNAIDTARAAAQAGRLVTFGITPREPATGFGYIEGGEKEPSGALAIRRFVEKPEEEAARAMIATGNFYWNSGMFLFATNVFLKECEKLAPEVFAAAQASIEKAVHDLDFVRLDPDEFAKATNISIDYAIFEKTDLASVVPSPIRWSDLGSWDAVWKAGGADAQGNIARGPVSLHGTSNSLVISEGVHVAVGAINDVTVVASEDAIYVGKLSEAQNVGTIVKTLLEDAKTARLAEEHRTVYRPWGGYSQLQKGDRFQVKRIFVKPGKKLSLQKHHHRSEHWVVVRGTADVTIDDKTVTITENQSVYIPQGSVHRMANPGKIQLEVIEVQTGSYLGEDDIVRIEDDFGRT
ncbi:mannose-1-phosphate guanylyltransferase/mannose-6-phosphate isomerase [Limoniibacter endophyticus]|uniref:mannose-1-phosphate guanylyltransferase n=1 Tax=Limoniibacter endophyticus TaxID=1565040 RepID=A0A8J3DQP8_9HYPH|nr:mannose-1-phosphate guanylyltransferase/mannose-6-phosphate isomerase [Limoniibacter endophyticus]GHC72717.1 mannose-1-phosphate guanylyltransferase [Limoniibacter endophyticus]